ncbi:MAG: T9SS type A sorting domain-containing protein, partial [Bacteroidales bacterium]|nr:T9SS type A sorting domain-containing protein [Bacteroidales bacterium]
TVEESDEVRVEIMNAVGAVLFTETSTKLPANIKAPEVPGVYMLRITSKGMGIRYVKLIVS